jgi:hypothetical protein
MGLKGRQLSKGKWQWAASAGMASQAAVQTVSTKDNKQQATGSNRQQETGSKQQTTGINRKHNEQHVAGSTDRARLVS